MTDLVSTLNSLLTTIFQCVFAACDAVYPAGGLWMVSIVAGIALAYLYGKLSNQAALKATKDSIYAGLLEVVLFRRHLSISLRAQGRMLISAVKYLALAVPPVLVLSVPCILLMAQMYLRYGHAPLAPGAQAIVSAETTDEEGLKAIAAIAPSGLILETETLHVPQEKRAYWRIRPLEGGEHRLTLTAGPAAAATVVSVRAGKDATEIASIHTSKWWWALLYPGAQILAPESGVQSLSVGYPELSLPFLGFNSSWIVIFLIVSIVSAFIFSKIWGVEL